MSPAGMILKELLLPNLWKIALGLGLLAVAVLFFIRPNPTSSPLPTPRATTAAPPTATPLNTQPATVQSLLPSPTPTPQPSTATPTPIAVYHVVQAGEVPLIIAGQYDISVDTLMSTNQITDPTRLQIGQQLLIPVTVTPSPPAPTPTPTPAASPTPTPEPLYHTVQAGDTLLALAQEYDTTVEAIVLVNELSNPNALRVGQSLQIPPDNLKFDAPLVIHVIEGGDTFSSLSFYYGSTIADILAANPGLEPTALQIGQKVVIPVTSPPVNPAANPRLPQVTSPDPIAPGLAGLQQQMVDLINSRRQAHSLSAYQPDAQLDQLALAHAQDMIARGYFAHTTPEGTTLDDRFDQQDIDANWNGENIQRNTKPFEQTASYALTWFMDSPPHRANILHDRFNRVGVGVVEEPPGWYTFVLVFAER